MIKLTIISSFLRRYNEICIFTYQEGPKVYALYYGAIILEFRWFWKSCLRNWMWFDFEVFARSAYEVVIKLKTFQFFARKILQHSGWDIFSVPFITETRYYYFFPKRNSTELLNKLKFDFCMSSFEFNISREIKFGEEWTEHIEWEIFW